MYSIEIQDLTYAYPDVGKNTLQNVTLRIEPGEWVLLQGATGSGKSTLLRALIGTIPAFYGGSIRGSVLIAGKRVEGLAPNERVRYVGFVGQDPESQAVYSTVGHEVAFALENLGVPASEMKWRVGEALDVVGLAGRTHEPLESLSGGERQRVALASALVHQPGILVFDEPTSQLDPVSAEEWFDIVRRVHDEFGITVVMSEHRIDRAYTLVNRVLYLEHGEVCFDCSPRDAARTLLSHRPDAAPTLARIRTGNEPHLSVREARQALAKSNPSSIVPKDICVEGPTLHERTALPLLEGKQVSAQYPNATQPALRECTFRIPNIGVTALIGSNGAGKSSLLRAIAGLLPTVGGRWGGELYTPSSRKRPQVGDERIGYLPQNPTRYLSQPTVREEVQFALSLRHLQGDRVSARVEELLRDFDLIAVRDRNPRDLSGGEQLRVAISCSVAANPTLLLLDEPTRGFDASQKQRLGEWLAEAECSTVVATHDMEFVAEYADYVLFMHAGEVVKAGHPRHVFSQALYFAPPLARAFREVDPRVLCLRDACDLGWTVG